MIKLTQSESANQNYLCKIIKVEAIRPHTNADRLAIVMVDGNSVITSKGVEIGDMFVYFPPESKINEDYLKLTNSFRNKESNIDPEKVGFFESNCRVRTMMLRGEPSMGYIVPLSSFEPMLGHNWIQLESMIGTEFDTLSDGFIDRLMVSKYIPKNNADQQRSGGGIGFGRKREVKEKFLIPGQFKLHINTAHLKRMVEHISPDDIISVTEKLHGTSLVAGNVLIRKELTFVQKLLKSLNVPILDTQYKTIVSSRNVIKSELGSSKNSYYETDVWSKAAAPILPFLNKGETIYAEIVGYQENGSPIQGKSNLCWDYGQEVGTCGVYIYRITYTDPDGNTVELPMNMLAERAKQLGVQSVPILYYGKAKDLIPNVDVTQHWHQGLLDYLETNYVEVGLDPMCKNKVEKEGVVLRKETLIPIPYKMKQMSFILKESQAMDKGEVDIETEELVDEEK